MAKKSKVAASLVGASALALAMAVPAAASVGSGNGTLQEVPTPASGSCADYMSPDSINWSGVGGGKWSASWENVCVRTVLYDNSRSSWYVR